MKPTIAIINATTVLEDAVFPAAVAAYQKQISGDIAAEWGTDAELVFVPRGGKPPATAWHCAFLDNADQAGALGYHDQTAHGLPIGKVFVKTTMSDGGLWTVTGSHELGEMLGDPNINRVATLERRGKSMRLYALELCDAPEADELGYDIDGTKVSDFVTQEWFDPNVTHTKPTSFRGNLHGAFTLAPGGYISYFDVGSGSGWQQATARDGERARNVRAHAGSRCERRRVAREHWRRSSAHAE